MADDDLLRPTQDSRRFFMLPQAPMDSGYYVYGTVHKQPARGAYQYAHPLMMTAILCVAFEWQAIDRRRFGVGDIRLAGGPQPPDHHSHVNGQVDIRPLRKDGLGAGICEGWILYEVAPPDVFVELGKRVCAPTWILRGQN